MGMSWVYQVFCHTIKYWTKFRFWPDHGVRWKMSKDCIMKGVQSHCEVTHLFVDYRLVASSFTFWPSPFWISLEKQVTIFSGRGYILLSLCPDLSWLRTRAKALVGNYQSQGCHTLKIDLSSIFIEMGPYLKKKMNIILYWRRPETNNKNHKHIWKLFTEVINQVSIRVIFS